MADSKKDETPKPSFGAVQAPPPRLRGGQLALTEEEGKALAAMITNSETGWVSDGLVYNEAGDAYAAANGYRRALVAYSLMPNGQTLGSRAQGADGEITLYLRWREPKKRKQAKG